VIGRCLASVRPFIDYWIIVDTGSTDHTADVIREALHDIPGELHQRPWVDFAHNRSEALELARTHGTYTLIIDADDVLEVTPGFELPRLNADSYTVKIVNKERHYWRPQLIRSSLPWRYEGVLHEFLSCGRDEKHQRVFDKNRSQRRLTGVLVRMSEQGARRRSSATERFARDAEVLEKALRTETDPFLRARYKFYLAQSYRDGGQKQKALAAYEERALLGFWNQEVFISLYQSAALKADLGFDEEDVIASYLKAHSVCEERAEALYGAAHYCRIKQRYQQGFDFAKRALKIGAPKDGLFLDEWIYQYALLDEFAVNAYWIGRYSECLEACTRLLSEGKLPEHLRQRVSNNAELARSKMASQVPASSAMRAGRSTLRMTENKVVKPSRLKLILICGPWGSGTSVVAELLDRLGAFGLGPYFKTKDPNTPNSYESMAFREIILRYASQQSLSLTPCAPGALQSELRGLQTRIEQGEFGPYDPHSPKPIFLKFPLSGLLIPQICEVFDTKLIYVIRPLGDIERTRLRRNWASHFGAEGGAIIYDAMSAALKHHPTPTLNVDYKNLLASPMVHVRIIAQFSGLDPSPAELQYAIDIVKTPEAVPASSVVGSGQVLPQEDVARRLARIAAYKKKKKDLTGKQHGQLQAPVSPDGVSSLRTRGPAAKEKKLPALSEPVGARIARGPAALNMRNRLHVLGVAHTIPHEDYLVCAFTAKILLFPDVIQPFGWDVVEYTNEGSVSNAREHVVILTKDRLKALSRRKSREEPFDADVNNPALKKEFQRVLLEKIRSRAKPGDIICHVWGPNMEVYNLLPNCHHIELSVGYTASPGLPFRVYESSAWMHWHYGKAGQEDGNHYKWVIPSAFDADRWALQEKPDDYALFLGRVTRRKGVDTLVEIAHRMPELPIHVYGPGDTSHWTKQVPANLVFKGPVFGDERVDVVRRARCMLMPTIFIEPFGFSGIEAQLCGVPLIAASYGAFQETVIDGVTGYRCHTLADWVEAIKLSAMLDRRQIATLARSKYSKEVVGKQYDWALAQLADLSGRGWYAAGSHKFARATVLQQENASRTPRIWLYMPYFGPFPNYFQLYLDSLKENADYLSVILMTDNDLSGYRVPDNLIRVQMTLGALREKAARFINDEYGMNVQPDAVIKKPYKASDFRILYPKLFRDMSEQYGVTEDDFVGWGDCDLIYGRFSDFLDMKEDYHVIGGFHGHLAAVRNTDSFRELFKKVEGLPELLLDENSHAVDEIAFRKPLLDFLEHNGYEMFYINRYFCDIVPKCFFERFRQDHAQRKKNFFDAYHPDKEIDYVHYGRDGRLTVVYEDGQTRQTIYCHLQKRAMSIDFERHENGFDIREDTFRLAS